MIAQFTIRVLLVADLQNHLAVPDLSSKNIIPQKILLSVMSNEFSEIRSVS